jgi:TolB-like protein
MLEVYVNGNKETVLSHRSTHNIIVNDGSHLLSFQALNGYVQNTPPVGNRNNLSINAHSEQITIEVKIGSNRQAVANITSQTSFQPSLKPPNISSNSMENAVIKASESLIVDLPKNITIAVLSISSMDGDMATFVVEELEYQLVHSKEFRVVDRTTLDKIRAEQNFQLSGDVDDNSAISIGKMLGANIVITGNISGSGTSINHKSFGCSNCSDSYHGKRGVLTAARIFTGYAVLTNRVKRHKFPLFSSQKRKCRVTFL